MVTKFMILGTDNWGRLKADEEMELETVGVIELLNCSAGWLKPCENKGEGLVGVLKDVVEEVAAKKETCTKG